MARLSAAWKYVSSNDFSDYCKVCHVDAYESQLEAYDQTGFFQPLRRLVLPDDYVIENASTPHPASPFYVPGRPNVGKWEDLLYVLFNLTNFYRHPELGCVSRALKNGHPLDVALSAALPYVQIPRETEFKRWDDYRVRTSDNLRERGAQHYYSRWQLFVLNDLNRINSTTTNHLIGVKSGRGKPGEIVTPRLDRYSKLFQTVANYEMREHLVWLLHTDRMKDRFMEPKRWDRIVNATNDVAKDEYSRHAEESWVEFLRVLVDMHLNHEKSEQVTLSRESKNFLRKVVEMMMYAEGVELNVVASKYDGKFEGYKQRCIDDDILIYPGEIERIFPDENKQAEEHARALMEGFVRAMNDRLPKALPDETGDNLVRRLTALGYGNLLSHLHEINHLWNNPRLHWRSSSWAHTRSLVVSIESIGREWFGGSSLSETLSGAFGSDYQELHRSLGSNATMTTTPDEYENLMERIRKKSEQVPFELCGCHLVAVHLTRNYLSHQLHAIDSFSSRTYLYLHECVAFTLLSLFVRWQKST